MRWLVRPCALVVPLLWAAVAAGGVLKTWEQDDADAFRRGRAEGVVITDRGRLLLGHPIEATAPLEAARVWDLAVDAEGDVWAATGDHGRVYRMAAGGDRWELAAGLDDSQATALAVLPSGAVAVGTGPGGRVVLLVDDGEPREERLGPTVRYVWDLAVGPEGDLYAATGPEGQLWHRDPEGGWSLLFDAAGDHLLCVAVGADGRAFAGGEGGVVYRVERDGTAAVVYDATESEIRCLLIAPDGSLFAGTATGDGDDDRAERSGAGRVLLAAFAEDVEIPLGAATSEAEGTNAVYHFAEGGGPLVVDRTDRPILALAWWAGRLVVGTGGEAEVIELVGTRAEAASLAEPEAGQVLAMAVDRDGRLLIGTGAPGTVAALGRGHRDRGVFTSEVHDTGHVSRFGAVRWRAEGGRVALSLRTGDVERPDGTWSDWSAPQDDPEAGIADVPPGRFVQYRLELATDDPARSPAVDAVTIRYQSVNLPPEVTAITVPPSEVSEDAEKKGPLKLSWKASDPNDDELSYALAIRKEGWPEWVRLGPDRLGEASFEWDAASVPAGRYRVRVTASDRRSNLPAASFERSMVSDPFLVDHQGPRVDVRRAEGKVIAAVEDEHSRVARVEYALDGGEWTPVFPVDGLYDTRSERVEIMPEGLDDGAHVLVIRAVDAAGNVGAGDLVIGGESP